MASGNDSPSSYIHRAPRNLTSLVVRRLACDSEIGGEGQALAAIKAKMQQNVTDIKTMKRGYIPSPAVHSIPWWKWKESELESRVR